MSAARGNEGAAVSGRAARAPARVLVALATPLLLAACVAVAQPPGAPVDARIQPDTEVGRGKLHVDRAWLADPTGRIPSSALGSALGAESLMVLLRNGQKLQVTLPQDRVFEDLAPRVVDLDRDGLEEILVVESDRRLGASLAVYGMRIGQPNLVKLGASPFAGQPMRWLHPLGTGDFDGDGWLDIALVESPEIGGSVVLYRYQQGRFNEIGRYFGVSTHETGSRELRTTRIVRGQTRDHLLVPDQSWKKLLLLSWRPTGVHRMKEWPLPAKLARLDPAASGQVTAILRNAEALVIDLPRLE